MRWFRRHRTEPTDRSAALVRGRRPAKENCYLARCEPRQATTMANRTGHAPGRLSDGTMPRDNPAQDDWPSRSLPASLVRGLVALLAAPFLLLAVLVIGCWLKASGQLTGGVWQRRIGPQPGNRSERPGRVAGESGWIG